MAPANGALAVIIPTLNAARHVDLLVDAMRLQVRPPDDLVVIDSSSDDDGARRLAASLGGRLLVVARHEFDHGGTRNLAVAATTAATVVFLTQDARPADGAALESIERALNEDPAVGLAYGRQVPRPDAGPLSRAHRQFNYPDVAATRTAADIPTLGTRAAFCSNAFAAYRRTALEAVGGFPAPVIGSEDRAVAARLLVAGWSVRYEPQARVVHSHEYGLADDLRRYFDIGVFHATQPWFDKLLGEASGEGVRLVRHQIRLLRAQRVPLGAFRVVAHSSAGFVGYRLGRAHWRLPRRAVRRLTTAPAYWGSASS